MKGKLNTIPHVLFFVALLLFCARTGWAIGDMKGNLDKNERNFFDQTLVPILINNKVCVSATKDCRGNEYFICSSYKTLSCGVYGISDKKVIKEILTAVLNSGLKISSFTFWRSKYHKNEIFEKPIVEFVDRTVLDK